MAPFYGWGSTALRLEPLRGGNLLFTNKFPEILGTHSIDLGRMKGWVDLGATQWIWTWGPWFGNLALIYNLIYKPTKFENYHCIHCGNLYIQYLKFFFSITNISYPLICKRDKNISFPKNFEFRKMFPWCIEYREILKL